MSRYTIISFLSVIILTSIVVAKENSDVIDRLKVLMNQERENKHEGVVRITDEELKSTDPQQVLTLLALYEKDPSWSVRHMAYYYEVQLARLHPTTPRVRQEVTKRLVNEILDPLDPNNNVGGHACSWLMSFVERDFSEESKTKLRQAFLKEPNRVCLIKLYGVANIQTVLPRLKELLIDEIAYRTDPNMKGEKWYYTVGWDARLARARMGFKEDIDRCIELAGLELNKKLMPLNLFHDIGYIRQPEAINFLKNYVYSDERLDQVKPTAPGEPVASYVIDILSESLSNFPIQRREGRGYTQEEIGLCRKWMSEQTEWKIVR